MKYLKKKIEQKFSQSISNVKHDDPFKDVQIRSLHNQRADELDALNAFKKDENRSKKENVPKISKTN